MDLRTKKQKAIENAAERISGGNYGEATFDEICKVLEHEFRDVHEIQEDDGR